MSAAETGNDPRLRAFLAWASDRALASPQAMRRVAQELFELASKSPVHERHIEELISRYKAGLAGPQAVLHARTVGDELLRWQSDSRSTVVPGSASSPPSDAPRAGAPEQPFDLASSIPPRPEAETGVDTTAATMPAPPDVVPAEDPPPEARPATDTAGRFRCTACRAFVTATGDRRCPVCGTPVVVVSLPAGSRPPPEAEARPLSRWLVFGPAIALACFLAWFGFRVGAGPEPGRPVDGKHTSAHLGLAFDLRPGWFHAPDLDREEKRDGWARHTSVFYRGESSAHFDAQLTVVVLDEKSGRLATDDDVKAIAAREALPNARGRYCGPRTIAGRETQRCKIVALGPGVSYEGTEITFSLAGRVVFARLLTFSQSGPQEEQYGAGVITQDPKALVTTEADVVVTSMAPAR